jgi:hypothetical protein
MEQWGGFVPAEPRTRYELLMHINEQSPVTLRKSLNKRFRHVKVWVAGQENPAQYLMGGASIGDLTAAGDIYAVASHSRIDLEAMARLLIQPELKEPSYPQIRISTDSYPEKVSAREVFYLPVTIKNASGETLSSLPPHPINVSYHWLKQDTAEPAVFDGVRTNLPRLLVPGGRCQLSAKVEAPSTPGLYECAIMLVQEGCRWFGQREGVSEAILVCDPGDASTSIT